MIFVVPILCGIGCAVALWAAVRFDEAVARLMAVALFMVWATANIAWLYDSLWLLPVLDLYLGITSISLWWSTKTGWLKLFAHAAAMRLILHVLDGMTGQLFHLAYIHALNATFAWMLVIVATAGGQHGPRRLGRLRDRLFRLRVPVLTRAAQGLSHGRG